MRIRLWEVPHCLLVQVDEADHAGGYRARKLSRHFLEAADVEFQRIAFRNEHGIVPPADRLRADGRGQLPDGSENLPLVRHERLNVLSIGRDCYKPELAKGVQLGKKLAKAVLSGQTDGALKAYAGFFGL